MADAQARRQQQERDNQQQQLQARAQSLFNSGKGSYNAGNYQNAIDQLNQSLAINPRQAEVCFYIGASYLELKNFAKAQENFRKGHPAQAGPRPGPPEPGHPGPVRQELRPGHHPPAESRPARRRAGLFGGQAQGILQELEVRKSFAVSINRSIAVEHGALHRRVQRVPRVHRRQREVRDERSQTRLQRTDQIDEEHPIRQGTSFLLQVGDQKYKFSIQNANAYADISRLLPEYIKVLRQPAPALC